MKTPEEIKKGLECGFCHECPYDDDEQETVEECARQVHKDALAYIRQLEDGIDKTLKLVQSADKQIREKLIEIESRLAQAERERDAAVVDMKKLVARLGYGPCRFCKKSKETNEACCSTCDWKWRGVCEENSK